MTRTAKEEAKQLQVEFLQLLRRQFYGDNDKAFFQQRSYLIQAIGWIAGWLKDRGVWLPLDRQRQILQHVIREIQHHGNTSRIAFFGGYFLAAVQRHLKHNDDHYYEEGKTAVAAAVNRMPFSDMLRGLQPASEPAQANSALAEFAQLARSGPRRGKKAKSNDAQQRMLL